jgi:ferredoxin
VARKRTPPLPSAARARKPPRPAKPPKQQPPPGQQPPHTGRAGRLRLRINPISCDGHGLCAELLPELLTLDDWGYPSPVVAEVPAELESHAQRAAQQCPTLAIMLERRHPRRDTRPADHPRRDTRPG